MKNLVDAVDDDWVSVSELARRKGISKQAVHKTVGRLVEQGLIQTKQGAGSSKLISFQAYEAAVGRTIDGIRAENGRASTPSTSQPSNTPVDARLTPSDKLVLSEQQARRTKIIADRQQILLETELKQLIRADEVSIAIDACAEVIIRSLDQLPTHADALVATAAEGVFAVRAKLKELGAELRKSMERALTNLAARSGLPDDAEDPAET